jgi:hypothetical protein
MEALKGYAGCLREAGQREQGRDGMMRLLMARYGNEKSCFISYDKALWSFRVTGGANGRSNKMLWFQYWGHLHFIRIDPFVR